MSRLTKEKNANIEKDYFITIKKRRIFRKS